MRNDDFDILGIDWTWVLACAAIVFFGQFCTGCLPKQYTTNSGIRVSVSGAVAWEPSEVLGAYVDFSITHWEEYFHTDLPAVRLAVQHLNITFACDYLETLPDGRQITGYQWGHRITLSILGGSKWRCCPPNYCIADASLTHELAHWILWVAYGDPDGGHKIDAVWNPRTGWVVDSRALARKHFCEEH